MNDEPISPRMSVPAAVRCFGAWLAHLGCAGIRARSAALAAAAAVTLAAAFAPLAGCGGGVGEEGTGYASGPITGFGSVIVNDIVFDDDAATVEDGEGAARARGDLQPGMTVEIESGAIVAGAARAARVRYDSALVGPVDSVGSDGFVVLGQPVAVDEATVYGAALAARLPALAALGAGQVVEVYGLVDAGSGRLRATRVERRAGAVAAWRVRGIVAAIDVVAGQPMLRIGGALFTYGTALNVPADLAVGRFVRLVVATDAPPGLLPRWRVLRFAEVHRTLADIDRFSLKGHIDAFTSAADLRVDGRRVDASAAEVSGGTLALGARVEVFGRWRGGVLQAERVRVRSDDEERRREFELRGPIESVSTDAGGAPVTLRLRGITVGLTRPPVYEDGTAADLRAGRSVEVRAVVSPGDGTLFDAVRVRLR